MRHRGREGVWVWAIDPLSLLLFPVSMIRKRLDQPKFDMKWQGRAPPVEFFCPSEQKKVAAGQGEERRMRHRRLNNGAPILATFSPDKFLPCPFLMQLVIFQQR